MGTQAAGSENMDVGGMFAQVPGTKTAAIHQGHHFDYLAPFEGCTFARGACTLIEAVSAELVALFFSRHVPVKLSRAPIPPSLIPPSITLTPKQAFFAGAHLTGIRQIETTQGCSVDLRWEDPLDTGSRHLGS